MGELTGADIRSFFVVAAAVAAFVLLMMNLAEKIRAAKQPQNDISTWRKETDSKLANDRKRLDSLENGNNELCKGMVAIMNHMIDNNSIDKLKLARDELTRYLINR